VAELVHHRGEQVDAAGGQLVRIGLQAGAGERVAELGVVRRIGVDVPAIAGGIGVDLDMAAIGRADIEAAEIGDAERDLVQGGALLRRQSRRLPARDGGGDGGIKPGLRQVRLDRAGRDRRDNGLLRVRRDIRHGVAQGHGLLIVCGSV
jgi:hypothetical protein